MFRCQRKCRQFEPDYPLQHSRCDVMVASQSPKLFVAVRVRTPRPMVGSTGVRLGLINPGERSDGLQRKGSNLLPTTSILWCDHSVMVALDIVTVSVRIQIPMVTPKKIGALADVVIAAV
jgi:hypothetical protein